MREFLKSKKFVMACVGLVSVVLSFAAQKAGVTVPEEKVAEFLGVIAAYLLGQGMADFGKGKADLSGEAFNGKKIAEAIKRNAKTKDPE